MHERRRTILPRPVTRKIGVTCVLLSLGGCEQATTFIGEAASQTADFVMGRRINALVDDGTECFAGPRRDFYLAVDEVTAAHRMQIAAGIGAIGAVATAAMVDSTLAMVAAGGLAVALAAVVVDLQLDRERAETVSRTFEALVACRKNEARQLNAALKKGTITREEAEPRMAALRALVQEDTVIAQETNELLVARTESFELSVEEAQEQAAQAEAMARKKAEMRAQLEAMAAREAIGGAA